MKKVVILIVVTFSFLSFLASCGGNKEKEEAWAKTRDSLQMVNDNQKMVLDNLAATMEKVSLGLDSITAEEEGIKKEFGSENKVNLKKKLEVISEIIANQRTKMSEMEQALQGNQEAIGRLKSIIIYLNNTLAQKEKEIRQLQQEIDNKNTHIAGLKYEIDGLHGDIDGLTKKNALQDESINTVYYIMGSKKKLNGMGLFKKKFLASKKVDYASLDKSMFTKADRRSLTTLEIPCKSPKIFDVPVDSYELTPINDNCCILKITNKDKFWKANNGLLIIQTK